MACTTVAGGSPKQQLTTWESSWKLLGSSRGTCTSSTVPPRRGPKLGYTRPGGVSEDYEAWNPTSKLSNEAEIGGARPEIKLLFDHSDSLYIMILSYIAFPSFKSIGTTFGGVKLDYEETIEVGNRFDALDAFQKEVLGSTKARTSNQSRR